MPFPCLLHCKFQFFVVFFFLSSGWWLWFIKWGSTQGQLLRTVAHNIVVRTVVWNIFFSFFLLLCASAEVLLQCHGRRTAGFPQVPAPAQAEASTTHRGENRGSHQHAHLQRPKTARERDHGLNLESQSLFHPLSCTEVVCKDTREMGVGKWWLFCGWQLDYFECKAGLLSSMSINIIPYSLWLSRIKILTIFPVEITSTLVKLQRVTHYSWEDNYRCRKAQNPESKRNGI